MKKQYILELEEDEIDEHPIAVFPLELKELKPKELKWIDKINFFHTKDYNYTIEKVNGTNRIAPVYRVFRHGLLLADRDLLNDAKRFCQEHYNKLFYEMMEGK